MDYNKHYNLLIEKARSRRDISGYSETHHILPRCMGGTDEDSNLVELTAEEHYVAHQLLTRIHPGNGKLITAAFLMTISPGNRRSNNKLYGWLRKQYSKAKSQSVREIWERKTDAEREEYSNKMREIYTNKSPEEKERLLAQIMNTKRNRTDNEKEITKEKRSAAVIAEYESRPESKKIERANKIQNAHAARSAEDKECSQKKRLSTIAKDPAALKAARAKRTETMNNYTPKQKAAHRSKLSASIKASWDRRKSGLQTDQ